MSLLIPWVDHHLLDRIEHEVRELCAERGAPSMVPVGFLLSLPEDIERHQFGTAFEAALEVFVDRLETGRRSAISAPAPKVARNFIGVCELGFVPGPPGLECYAPLREGRRGLSKGETSQEREE